MQKINLKKGLIVLMFCTLLIVILIYAKPFLIPFTFAAIISMLLFPVTTWLQKRVPYWLAVLTSVLLFVLVLSGIVSVLVWQLQGLMEDAGNMKQQVMQKIPKVQQYIQEKFGVSVQQQNKAASSSGGQSNSVFSTALPALLSALGGFLTDFILFLVYVFLFLLYRSHLKEFALRMFFPDNREEASGVMNDCRKVAEKYVSGMAIMIACLFVMYSLGFGIVGVKSFFLFAFLAAILETVPFIGNLLGTLLTMMMALAQGGSGMMVLGVFVTYLMVQFIQTYFLETLIVGDNVNINPLITIAGLVAGELIWGIPGMVLSIPLMGIIKIVFDNVGPLRPLGFLMGKVKQ